jgi:hypothetical protein
MVPCKSNRKDKEFDYNFLIGCGLDLFYFPDFILKLSGFFFGKSYFPYSGYNGSMFHVRAIEKPKNLTINFLLVVDWTFSTFLI